MFSHTLIFIISIISFFLGLIVGYFLFQSSSAVDEKDMIDPEKGAYIKGLKYIISNEPDKAIAEFTRAVQINSDTVEIYLNLGNLFRDRGEIERAIRIHQSILLRPNLSPEVKKSALMDLGLDYSAAGIFDRAIGIFQQLISLHPDNLQAHIELEKLYEEEKDLEKAFQEAKTCQKLSKEDNSSLLAHIITEIGKELYAKNEINQAIKELKKAIIINKNCIEAYLYLGDIYFDEEKYTLAISVWEKIIHLKLPFTQLVYEKLEKAFLKKGAYDRIEEIYLEVLNNSPQDNNTRIILAEYYYKKGLSHKAIQVLKDGLKLRHSPKLRHKLGKILLKEGLDKEAIDEYKIIIEEMKGQRFFRCNKCGYLANEVIWKCPQCKEWDSFSEEDN